MPNGYFKKIEWIDSRCLTNIRHLADGGFGTVEIATCQGGLDEEEVVLKTIRGNGIMPQFLNEVVNNDEFATCVTCLINIYYYFKAFQYIKTPRLVVVTIGFTERRYKASSVEKVCAGHGLLRKRRPAYFYLKNVQHDYLEGSQTYALPYFESHLSCSQEWNNTLRYPQWQYLKTEFVSYPYSIN
jgi:hypothetical protein